VTKLNKSIRKHGGKDIGKFINIFLKEVSLEMSRLIADPDE
jgi:hypothetical protein